MARDPRLLRLAPEDNVLVAITNLEAGTEVQLPDGSVRLREAIPLGHKLAARRIAAGEVILKYNGSIGEATRDIEAGDHVHVHNVKSTYLPTYTRDDRRRYV